MTLKVIKRDTTPKCTPVRCQAILDSISRRIPYKIAAHSAGIGATTLYDWLRKGKADLAENVESEYASFAQSVSSVEQERIAEHLDNIRMRLKNWQADAWILERRWPDFFSQSAHLTDLAKKIDFLEKLLMSKGKDAV